MLEYKEFLPVMVEIVFALRARNAAVEARDAEDAEARDAVETYLLRGVPKDNLENIMIRLGPAPPVSCACHEHRRNRVRGSCERTCS